MGNVGRNDPCPCGSGKKYKKCCEKKTGLQRHQFTNLNREGTESNMSKIVGAASDTLQSPQVEGKHSLRERVKKQTGEKKEGE